MKKLKNVNMYGLKMKKKKRKIKRIVNIGVKKVGIIKVRKIRKAFKRRIIKKARKKIDIISMLIFCCIKN